MTLKNSIVIGFIACGFLGGLNGSEVNASAMKQTTSGKEELFQRKKQMIQDLINSRMTNNICWDMEAESSFMENILLGVGATKVKINEISQTSLPKEVDGYLKLLKCKLGEERVYVLIYPRFMEKVIVGESATTGVMSQLKLANENCGVAYYRLGKRTGEDLKIQMNFADDLSTIWGMLDELKSILINKRSKIKAVFIEPKEKEILDIIDKATDKEEAFWNFVKIENISGIMNMMYEKLLESGLYNIGYARVNVKWK